MALRAVPDHPKFAGLKARLSIGRMEAMGALECLWHFCGRFTPQGNIGKYTDAQIEAWMEWKGQPGALISALIAERWIDEDATHRLVVHDWHIHADKATKNSLVRTSQRFVIQPYTESTDAVRTPYPLPVPVPESIPDPVPEPIPSAPPPAEPIAGIPFLDMPTNKSGEAFTVTEELLFEWGPLYPAVDVRQQIRNMRGWLDGNPDRRKTRKGVTRFIHNWLGDKQNKAGANGTSKGNSGSDGTRGAAVGRVERGQSAFRAAAIASVEASGGFPVGPDDSGVPFAGAAPGHGADVPARGGDASGGVRDPASADGPGIFPDAPEILPPSQRNSGGPGSHGSQRAH